MIKLTQKEWDALTEMIGNYEEIIYRQDKIINKQAELIQYQNNLIHKQNVKISVLKDMLIEE